MPSPLGRPIRVGVFEHDPDAFNCFRLLPEKRCPKPGAEIEIIKIVMEMLDWSWQIVDTHKEFDVVNDFGNILPDGNFSGIMGLLASDSIDMGGLSMRITPDRMRVAHFTFPIRYFQVYIIKRPPENDFRNFIFASFGTTMWLTILLSIVGVALIRFLIALLIDRKNGPKTNIFGSSLLETYGIMLKQRVADPTAASTMVLEAALIVSMMFVCQYYQTSMNSKLTAPPKPAIPFLHQDQLIDLFERGDSYPTYYFDLMLEGSNEKNEERLEKYWKRNPVRTHDNEKEMIMEIQFNKALLTILPGVPQITLGPGYAHKKDPENTSVKAKRTSLSFKKHLEQLFVIFSAGLCLSIVIFFIEIVVCYLENKRKVVKYRLDRSISNETSQTFVTIQRL